MRPGGRSHGPTLGLGATLIVLSLAASPAPAMAAGPRHTVGAKAWMYTRPAELDTRGRIQILSRVCPGAWPAIDGCTGIGRRLRHAIARRIDVPLTWVSEEQPDAGDFWVLSPIRFEGERARFSFRWHEQGPFACAGHGRLAFRWSVQRDRWRSSGGTQATGCP
jgi:hypothetical protein